MELHKETEGTSVTGYTERSNNGTSIFPITRVIEMKVFHYNGKHYVRTRDAADLLGMKQPFQFTAYCREFLGENAILKGEDTESFRSAEDSPRVTFIEANDLLNYLLSDTTYYLQTLEKGMCRAVISGLQNLVKKE